MTRTDPAVALKGWPWKPVRVAPFWRALAAGPTRGLLRGNGFEAECGCTPELSRAAEQTRQEDHNRAIADHSRRQAERSRKFNNTEAARTNWISRADNGSSPTPT